MITLTHKLPDNQKFFVACSGGVDSMSVLKWLSEGNRLPFGIIYVHHNTGNYADQALDFVVKNTTDYSDQLFIYRIEGKPPRGTSKEDWWRDNRYKAFQQIIDKTQNYPIILGHNLDDCVEQYIMSTMIRIRTNTIINYNGPSNTIRPFRTWKKRDIIEYAQNKGIKWIEDPSNTDTSFTRNKVRHDLLPIIANMNPGIYRHVKQLILNENLLRKE